MCLRGLHSRGPVSLPFGSETPKLTSCYLQHWLCGFIAPLRSEHHAKHRKWHIGMQGGEKRKWVAGCRTMQNTLFPFGRSVPGSPVKLGNDSFRQFCDANVPKPNQLWRLSPVFRGFILFESIYSVCVHVFVTAVLLVMFSFIYSRILGVCADGFYVLVCLLFWLLIASTVQQALKMFC